MYESPKENFQRERLKEYSQDIFLKHSNKYLKEKFFPSKYLNLLKTIMRKQFLLNYRCQSEFIYKQQKLNQKNNLFFLTANKINTNQLLLSGILNNKFRIFVYEDHY